MDDSSFQTALEKLPAGYRKSVLETAESLMGPEYDAFVEDIIRIAEKFEKEQQEADAVLVEIEAMVVEAEHMVHAGEREEVIVKETHEHEQDMQTAESLINNS